MPHVLVIDDDQDVRRVMRKLLEMSGHVVTEAGDGKEGMRRFQARRPDLVIVDLFMPEQDGLQTIREVRRAEKAVPVLVVTGIAPGGPMDFRSHAVLLGAMQTLTKPFTSEEFLGAVREALR